MARFGIGARVRDDDGDTGVIVAKRKGFRTIEYDERCGFTPGFTMEKKKSDLTPIEAATDESSKTSELQIGDRVRFVENYAGAQVGDEGVIAGFWTDHEGNAKGGVSVDANGTQYDCYAYRVERIEPVAVASATATPKFKAGDKVRALKDSHDCDYVAGHIYEVREYIEDYHHIKTVTDEDGSTTNGWGADNFELVQPTKFKVGDKVRIVRSDYDCKQDHIGREFVIHGHCGELDGEDTWNGVFGSASQPYRWKESELELVVASADFKIGDKVKSSENTWTNYEVIAVHDDTIDVTANRDEGKRGFKFRNQPKSLFTVIEPAPAQAGADAPTESFIVARLTPSGHPRPNARPRVHTTLDSANTEAQRLADRLGDEFAVYQRVSSRTVDAGDVPSGFGGPFNVELAKAWLSGGTGECFGPGGQHAGMAFAWSKSTQGVGFWSDQCDHLTPLGRAILRKWIAQSTTATEAA